MATSVGGIGQHRAVDVAQRDDLDRRDLDQPEEVGLAVPAGADEADPLLGVGQSLRVAGDRAQGQRRAGGLQEAASVHGGRI